MEPVTLSDLNSLEKAQLLEALGYGYDSNSLQVTKDGKLYRDPYSGMTVSIDSMAIMPGSAIVIDNNPISIAGYVADYLTGD